MFNETLSSLRRPSSPPPPNPTPTSTRCPAPGTLTPSLLRPPALPCLRTQCGAAVAHTATVRPNQSEAKAAAACAARLALALAPDAKGAAADWPHWAHTTAQAHRLRGARPPAAGTRASGARLCAPRSNRTCAVLSAIRRFGAPPPPLLHIRSYPLH